MGISNVSLSENESVNFSLKVIQEKLLELNYYTKQADGIWNKELHASMRRFQQEHGISATGQLNIQTLEKMGFVMEKQIMIPLFDIISDPKDANKIFLISRGKDR